MQVAFGPMFVVISHIVCIRLGFGSGWVVKTVLVIVIFIGGKRRGLLFRLWFCVLGFGFGLSWKRECEEKVKAVVFDCWFRFW